MSNQGGVLESVLCEEYGLCRVTDGFYLTRYELHACNLRASMTSRDTEVVPSPLAEQQQEDGQRHRLAGTLSTDSRFAPTIAPRENYVWCQAKSSGFTRSGFAGVVPTVRPGGLR